MPVIPKDSAGYEIRSPTTIHDKGGPSSSIRSDVDRVFALIDDERHLTAETLLTSVRERLHEWERRPQNPRMQFLEQKARRHSASLRSKEMSEVRSILAAKEEVIDKLENRCHLFRRAQQNLRESDDWTVASKHFGITTFYRREEDQSLSIKLEGEMKGAPLFEQICVLKEVDLHYLWSPFCSSSLTVADLDKLDMVGWFLIGMPNFGLARDGCFRAIGCDNFEEDGSIILTGQGIHDTMPGQTPPEPTFLGSDPIIETLDIPAAPTRRGSGRMTIRKFEAMLHITSPSTAQTKIVANMNPNIGVLPQSLLEFVMKHLAGVMLSKLQYAAKKAALNPEKNRHAKKMREEEDFYRKWLLAKFRGICASKGWELPYVAALEMTKSNPRLDATQSYLRKRAQTFDGHASSDRTTEEMSALSNPLEEADTMSEISTETGRFSVLSNNPVSAYMREIEAKTQRRKDDEVLQARQKAANRLRPRELPSEKLERLDELKQVKARRAFLDGTAPRREHHASSGRRSVQLFSRKLYGQGFFTRMIVILTLLSTLFLVLHPQPLLGLLSWTYDPTASRSVYLREHCAVAAYIVLCAISHFLVCDVALVYTFDALDIGSKAGREVKKYYSDNVRLGVAAGSLGIVCISIAKAAAGVLAKFVLWALRMLFSYVDAAFLSRMWENIVSHVPTQLRDVSGAIYEFVSAHAATAYVTIEPITQLSTRLTESGIVRSSVAGKAIRKALAMCLSAMRSAKGSVFDHPEVPIASFQWRDALYAGRTDAFRMARSLFLYSAVFLLAAVVLFLISVPRTQGSAAASDEIISPTKASESFSFTDIPEEGTVDETKPMSPSSSTSSKRHGPRLRFLADSQTENASAAYGRRNKKVHSFES